MRNRLLLTLLSAAAIGAGTLSAHLARAEDRVPPRTPDRGGSGAEPRGPARAPDEAAKAGIEWLIAAQGPDGGWGDDKQMPPDVATTALATLALLRNGAVPGKGPDGIAAAKGIEFLRARVAAAPAEGILVETRTGTQPQRKLGPAIDTFLAALALARADGRIEDANLAKGAREALAKCVAKIEAGQRADGTWVAGGWAPVLASTFAQMGLEGAKARGLAVNEAKLALATEAAKKRAGEGGRFDARDGAGVELYAIAGTLRGAAQEADAKAAEARERNEQVARELEKAGRVEDARAKRQQVDEEVAASRPAPVAQAIERMADDRTLAGFGSMGGEEFVSYMMASETLAKLGGKEWEDWNAKIKARVAALQNADCTWAGHHCITSRVFCTAAAVMTLTQERELAANKATRTF